MSCSHPELVVDLATRLAAGANALDGEAVAARQAVTGAATLWHGPAAAAFTSTGMRLTAQLGANATALRDAASALMTMAQTLDFAHDLWH